MRDLFSQVQHVQVVAAAALTATPSRVVIDTKGYQSCVFEILTGIGGIAFTSVNKIEWTLEESDADDGGWAAPDAEYVQLQAGEEYGADGIVRAHTAAHDAASSRKVGYTGYKRFLSIRPVFSGTHGENATPVAATAILSHPLSAPVG